MLANAPLPLDLEDSIAKIEFSIDKLRIEVEASDLNALSLSEHFTLKVRLQSLRSDMYEKLLGPVEKNFWRRYKAAFHYQPPRVSKPQPSPPLALGDLDL